MFRRSVASTLPNVPEEQPGLLTGSHRFGESATQQDPPPPDGTDVNGMCPVSESGGSAPLSERP